MIVVVATHSLSLLHHSRDEVIQTANALGTVTATVRRWENDNLLPDLLKPPLARLFIYIVPRMSNSCRTIYLGHWKLGNLLDTVLCLSTFQSHVLCPFKRLRQSHMPTTRGLTICLRRCLPTTRKLMAKEFRSRTPVSASLWSACQLEAKA